MSKQLDTLKEENKTMRKHLGALHVYATAGKNPGRDLNEFADEFPRTWNAIITDDPTSFDLPGPVSTERAPQEK